ACFRRLVERALLEHLGAGADGGDRVLELVREVRGEGLDERAPFELAPHRVERAAQVHDLATVDERWRRGEIALAHALAESAQGFDRRGDGAADPGGGE